MDFEKHNRTVPMHCPTCAGTSFQDPEPDGADSRVLRCESCGLELTSKELLDANAENVAVNLEEMKAAVLKDVENELRDKLKKAFSGNKNIRLK